MSLNPTGTGKQEHTRKKYFTLSFTDFFEEYMKMNSCQSPLLMMDHLKIVLRLFK